MKVYRSLAGFEPGAGSVATIGSFDGAHKGHRSILAELTDAARANGLPSVIVTFHPHPRIVLEGPETDLALLQTQDEKLARFEELGIEKVLVIPFTQQVAQWHYSVFIEKVLLNTLQIRHLIIGYDHRFGRGREGGLPELIEAGNAHGFRVQEIPAHQVDEVNVSSTKIREALLQAGNVERAEQLLGYPYSLSGLVVEGDKRGREIGYPTANLSLAEHPHKLVPADGVYAVWVEWGGERYRGMMNIGWRPTVAGKDRRLEVNLLHFNRNLYGERLRVVFAARLRGEVRFGSLDELKAQLAQDQSDTERVLGQRIKH